MDVDQPQPNKKRKRKHSEFDDFCAVMMKLENDYDPSLFACHQCKIGKGVVCGDICATGAKLKGPFTSKTTAFD